MSQDLTLTSASPSPATAADVDHCYRTYLGREPDAGGKAHWLGEAQAGMSVDRMRYHFIASPEFHARSPEAKRAALADLGQGSPRVFPLSSILAVTAASYVDVFRQEVLGGVFDLPDDFNRDEDPDSPAYRDQQLALWRLITDRDGYDAVRDEDTPEIANLDVTSRPGFYLKGDVREAGEHLMAMGHILTLSGVTGGARVLEYGAGFGQIALAFARLGLRVDTIDINPHFCAAVDKLALRYGVDLAAHVGQFGDNPAGEPAAYDLIYFYESFHHCLDFKAVIPRLKTMLKPGGRIIMAGEPVLTALNGQIPYPWGLRLDGENVIIMRDRGWMELGFQEDFLLHAFAEAGFTGVRRDVPGFRYPTAYVFEPTAEAAG